ncbi:MAG: hypothetical protein J6N72_10710, partial [Psychrobacter sp.]|nr:hypothetical protein [Psychrobacter sp.]
MQKNDSNNGLDAEGKNTSMTPLGDDSVESLTIKPSPDLHKKPSDTTGGDLDNSNLDDAVDGKQPRLDKKPITGFYKDKPSQSSDDEFHQNLDDESVINEGVVDADYDEEDLSNVRVANMNDDLDAIELDFPFDRDDDDFVATTSAEQLSRDENLFALLR